jgi:hypothetical protein
MGTVRTAVDELEAEVSWLEDLEPCVLAGRHCWHVRIAVSVPIQPERWRRRCCWCGLAQWALCDNSRLTHGLFEVSSPRSLDHALAAQGDGR